jgi:hypothetical protein
MRRDHLDPFAVVEALRAPFDDEGRHALRARRLAGAREEDVEIGDAAVGDVGLGAVDDIAVAVGIGSRFHRGDVGA